jgi:hypothetical protein
MVCKFTMRCRSLTCLWRMAFSLNDRTEISKRSIAEVNLKDCIADLGHLIRVVSASSDDAFWLQGDILTGVPESPLYPRKQTFQAAVRNVSY